ncbi:MAG TPA: DinB family protein, partial [Dehalococcoidia bacterium]|nr:DinB family protein [Dehalococcoidia bacterium]
QPSPDDWSIAEIAHHFLQTSRGVARSVELLANGQTPDRTDHEPPRTAPTLAWTDLQTAIAEDSVTLAALITGLPEPPSFEQTSDHMFFGPLHGRAWYLFQRVHDVDHTNQVLANKQATDYPTS